MSETKVGIPMHLIVKYTLANMLLVFVWSSLVGLIVLSENKAHKKDYQIYAVELAEWLNTEDDMAGMKHQFSLPKRVDDALQLSNKHRIINYWMVWFLGVILTQVAFFIVVSQFRKRRLDKNKAEQSQEKYNNLSSLTFEGIFIHENGIIKDLNEAVVRILGYSKEEVLNISVNNIIKSEAEQNMVLDKLKQDYATPYEVTAMCKDGTNLTVEVESRRLNMANDNVRVTAFRDVTKRKTAENNLRLKNQELEAAEEEIRASNKELVATNDALKGSMRELESAEEGLRALMEELQIKNQTLAINQKELYAMNERLHLVINNIPVGVFWKDLNAKYLGCNNLFFQDAHFESTNEIIGKTTTEVNGERLGSYYSQLDHQVMDSKVPIINQIEEEGKGGNLRYIKTNRVPLVNEENEVVGVLGTYENITEIKEIEQELRLAKDRAEESDRLKSAFLANMSHEIRTPMNAIIGFSQLLEFGEKGDDKQAGFIEIIQKAGEQLLSLIDDILDISKIETGQVILKKNGVDVNSLLKNLESTFSLKAADNKNQLTLNIAVDDFNGLLITDKTRLRQLLSNLLTNALKFTQEGQVEFGYKLHDEKIEFFVKDTGCGIEAVELEKIFVRFHQTKNNHLAENNGVGLGLSICKGIVQLLDGNIWAESVPGKGSTFYFSLPFHIGAQVKNTVNNHPLTYSIDKLSILVAEDNIANYQVVEAMMASSNVTLYHALNGQQALDIFRQNPGINLVLMDIKMPELNGFEAAFTIKEENPDLPIIAQTAFAFTENKEEFMDARFDAYLTKPLMKDELYAAINRVMMNS